eukprot:CAMPEP_0115167480 /NCGR_PEP_ID=MMETSP0270-20121206/239_1 /TAXON_ID=71861 /ORGANISM="Scrippsiella trochoidea, Strain CCMP3099" /LENGTH=414 /DNA_ID=CAMNT_0002580077 /DNA_START=558 /DNA_END=1799 /DNA_ORIENTATION=+
MAPCHDCVDVFQDLNHGKMHVAIAARVRKVVGKSASSAASVGEVFVSNLNLPASTMACADVECLKHPAAVRASKVCYGSGCLEMCCKPMTCAQTACSAPMVLNHFQAESACHSMEDCGNKCCLMPCREFTCAKGSACPKPGAAKLRVPPGEADEKCCQKDLGALLQRADSMVQELQAVMPVQEFCMSQLRKWTPLMRLSADARDNATTIATPSRLDRIPRGISAQMALSKNDLSGGFAPLPFKGVIFNTSELDIIEPFGVVVGSDAEPGRADSNRSDSFFFGAEAERGTSVTAMFSHLLDAAVHHTHHSSQAVAEHDDSEPTSGEVWRQAFTEAKAHQHKVSAGCGGSWRQLRCPYTFSSIFVLHRGLSVRPRSTNTVQVLPDTRHAISCGDDGRCWIWEIASGRPKQVFQHGG